MVPKKQNSGPKKYRTTFLSSSCPKLTRLRYFDSCLPPISLTSVTRFFQQSLPKFCSNFTKLRKILPNVGYPNNYVVIMPKNNCCHQSRKNMPKRESRNTCRFHRIAVFANGSSVHHFEHVIKQETHIFTKVIINN
jgi:hypothetical protein